MRTSISRLLSTAALCATGAFFVSAAYADSPSSPAAQQEVSNGKMIATAPDGVVAQVGSLPINAILDSSDKYAIVTDSGFKEMLLSVDMTTGKAAGSLDFPSSGRRSNAPNVSGPYIGRSNGLYYGLARSGNTIYASQGAASQIAVASLGDDGSLTLQAPIVAQKGDFIAGLATDGRGNLYAVNNEFDDTSSRNNNPADMTTPGSLAIYSELTGKQIARLPLTGVLIPLPLTPFTPTSFPFAVATLTNGAKTYVTSQRDGLVYVINTLDPTNPTLASTIPVGKDPVSLLLSPDQSTLYCANADEDSISIIDTQGDAIKRTISLRPSGLETVTGVTPLGMSLSPDGSTLYVALGDMNAIAVINTADGTVRGEIPTGWYPNAVISSGSKLLIVDAKGVTSRTPNKPDTNATGGRRDTYILNILEGTTQFIDLPTQAQLNADTEAVLHRNKLAQAEMKSYGILSQIGIAANKIKHVIYIVKENRTYDQLLGDMPEGNGDPSLTLFGKNVTPNQHALAKRFVLLDNFYDSGDVSGDGWNWSTQGYATEYVARNVPYNYSSRGQQYNFEGQNNGYITGGFPATDPDGNLYSVLAPNGIPAIPDVAASSTGYIWDHARAAKLTLRNYGFFLSNGVAGVIPDNFPDATGLQPPGHDLKGNTDPDFRRFDLDYPDSSGPAYYYAKDANPNVLRPMTKYGKAGAASRYDEWAREFDMMMNADPSGSRVPNLMLVRFMCDHTSGARSGGLSPRADVADNDYAVGELIDHISKSQIWKSTVIFVVEDDAQDGEDHVDCHRSVCFIASPYIKNGSVDHTFYNTDSVLHTMEILLGMKPMCQYDAIATPFADFTKKPSNDKPYDAILPDESIIGERNPEASALRRTDPRRRLAVDSDRMKFSHADGVDSTLLNAIIWKTVRGVHSKDPRPQHHMIASDGQSLNTSSGSAEDDDQD